MHNKPAIAPRSVREALGPYARLELYEKPLPWWRLVWAYVWRVIVAVIGGVAFGGLLALVERI